MRSAPETVVRNVAIVSADFPPNSMPSSIRARLFVKYLPEFGWEPTVLTVEPKFYESAVDEENERLVAPGVDIVRSAALPPGLTRRFRFGDLGLRSAPFLLLELARLRRRKRIDLLAITIPPSFSLLIGRAAWALWGLPYITDYQDPWVTDTGTGQPAVRRSKKYGLSSAVARIAEPIAIRRTSAVLGVSQATADGVCARYPWLADVPRFEIPFGGEPGDFEHARANPRPNLVFDKSDGSLHVSYVGVCIPGMFPAIRAILAAVREGLRVSPALFERLRLHFVGTSYDPLNPEPSVLPLAREAGLEDIVTERPRRLSYLDALRTMLDSHALLIVGTDAKHYTASKVFPCILSRRPFLAVFHEASNIGRIVTETRSGEFVGYGDGAPVAAKAAEIHGCLERILGMRAGEAPPTSWADFERYSARAMTARLAESFDAALEFSNRGTCPEARRSAPRAERL